MSVRPFSEFGLRLLSLALVAAFGACAAAQAQQKAVPLPAHAVAVRQAVPDAQFEQWVFQQSQNASGARQRLDSVLAVHVEQIDRTCQLTDAQKKKLQLAGQGDIKRFFDRYETVKQKFQALKHDQQKLQQEIWQHIQPLQMSLQAGLFQDDSLLVKSLRNTLTAEQFARYEAIARERRAFRHRANIELAVTTLEQATPLGDTQRRELITLLTDQTKPPRKAGQYDYQSIMFQIGRLPDGKLKPLFDDLQWKVVNRQLAQFKGFEGILRQAGQLPDENDEAESTDEQPAAPKQ